MHRDDGLILEQKKELSVWADSSTNRIDQTLMTAWADLEVRITKIIEELTLKDLAFGHKKFSKRCQESVQAWVTRHVEPLLADVCREFPLEVKPSPAGAAKDLTVNAQSEGNVEIGDLVHLLSVGGGVTITITSIVGSVSTVTTWLVLTTIVIYWPLLIGGVAIGWVLTTFGVVKLAYLKRNLQDRLRAKLLPQIRAAVIGEGVNYKQQHYPSLLQKLMEWVEKTEEAAKQHLQ